MTYLRGAIRLLATVLLILIGTMVIFVLCWIPLRIRGARLSAWPATWMSRCGLWIYNIRFEAGNLEVLRQHQGFVFPNHESYIDPVFFMHLFPMRFLSNHQVRWWPFIGWIAMAVDTVFVHRGKQKSRTSARESIAEALKRRPYPPLILFPEGAIGVGDILLPFRRGAFEVAVQGQIPFLPCVLHYDPLDVVPWLDGESLFGAVWRLATHQGPIKASLTLLDVVYPTLEHDPHQLMETTHQAIDSTFKAALPA